jgi:hypothetical protein
LPSSADLSKLRSALERLASDMMIEIRLVETSLEAKPRKS